MSGLPTGWVLKQLGTFYAKTRNQDPSKAPSETFQLFSVPSFSEGDPEVILGREIKSSKQEVQPDDVLLCKIVPHINRVWVVSKKIGLRQIASGEWIVLRDHGCEPNFLRYLLSEGSFRTEFLKTVAGVGGSLMRARPSEVAEIEVPLAPLAEQRRIVAKLDSLTARTARARSELDHIPRLVEKYKQAILAKAYDDARSSAESFSTLGKLSLSVRNGLSRRPEHHPPGIPILKISAVRQMKIRHDERRFYVSDAGEDVSGFMLREGDLLFTRYNGNPDLVGNCGMIRKVDGPLLYPDKLILVRLDQQRMISEFAELMFASPQIRDALSPFIKSAAGQHGISGGDLKGLQLPVPELRKQRATVVHIHQAFSWIEKVAAEHARASHLVPKLDQSILAKAFRGELVPQDPNDEPASLLLERIGAVMAGDAPRLTRSPKRTSGR